MATAQTMRFKLDAALVTDPLNWKETQITVNRDEDTDGIVWEVSSEYVFGNRNSGAYSTLRTAYDADPCDSFDFELEYACGGAALSTLWEGVLYVADIEWNLRRCEARAKITDTSYIAKIQANRGIKVLIGVGRSKNDVSYTGATQQSIALFRPDTGTYPGGYNVEAYTVADALEDIVAFCTDDTVTFTNNVTELDSLVLMTGEAMNNHTSGIDYPPEISFDDLFSEIKKLYPIGFKIDTSLATPDFVVDSLDDLYDTTSAVSITNTRWVTESVLTERLYDRVRIGSTTTQKDESGTYQWPALRWISQKQESFHLAGQCNTANAFDLLNTILIFDSNVVERVVMGVVSGPKVTDFDDDTFIIETDLPGTSQAKQSDVFSPGSVPVVYNRELANDKVAPRYEGVIPNDLLLFLGSGNDYCDVERTASTTHAATASVILFPVDYDTENSDPGGNFDNTPGNYDYTAPQNGVYGVTTMCRVDAITRTASSGDPVITIRIKRFDSGATLRATFADSATVTGSFLEFNFQPPAFYMDASDYFQVEYEVAWDGGGPFVGSTFDINGGTMEVVEAVTGGGIYATFDIDDARIISYEFECPLAQSDWDTIFANQEQAITVTLPDSSTKKMWILSMDYDLYFKKARFKCVTTKNT